MSHYAAMLGALRASYERVMGPLDDASFEDVKRWALRWYASRKPTSETRLLTDE